MKHKFLIPACVFCLVVMSATSPQRTVTFYDIPLDSMRVINQPTWGPYIDCSMAYPSTPILAPDLYAFMGSTYTSNLADGGFNAQPKPFLNMLSPDAEPLLEKANFAYYEQKGLDQLKEQQGTNHQFDNLITGFASGSVIQRRTLLRSNTAFAKALAQTRYQPETAFAVNAQNELNKVLAFDIGARLGNPFEKLKFIKMGAGLSDSLRKISLSMRRAKNMKVHLLQFDPDYISLLNSVLAPYQEGISASQLTLTGFNTLFRRFLRSPYLGIIAGAAVVEAEFSTMDSTRFNRRFNAAIKASMPAKLLVSDTLALARAKLEARKLNKSILGVETGKHYWYISYARVSDWELQTKDSRHPFTPCQD